MSFVLLISLILASQVGLANKANVCENIEPLLCSHQDRDDGTGPRVNSNDLPYKKQNDLKKLADENAKQFEKYFSDPTKSDFREQAFNTFPYLKKNCKTPASLQKDPCKRIFARETAALINEFNLEPIQQSEKEILNLPMGQMNLRAFSKLLETVEFDNIAFKHKKDIEKLNVDPEFEKKVQDNLFPLVKKTLADKVSALDIDEQQKAKMLARIGKIEFAGFECDEQGSRSRLKALHAKYLPLAFLEAKGASKDEYKFKICRGITGAVQSEFSLIFILAHEMSHSIDPCLFSYNSNRPRGVSLEKLDSEYPIPHLISCLRDPQSVQAETKQMFCQKIKKDKGRFQENQCSDAPAYQCNFTNLGPMDQIGEATSDHFATEVLAELIPARHKDLTADQWKNGISNLFPVSLECQEHEQYQYQEHPSQVDRLNKIVLAHPKIRQKAGCPPKSQNLKYCDLGLNNKRVSTSSNKKEEGAQP